MDLYAVVTEASTISFTDLVAFFVHFPTALIKRSMNLETADANTMFSAAE